MSIKFELDKGEFESNLNRYTKSILPNNLEKGMNKACLLVVADSKKICPIRYGHLRASITREVDKKDDEVIGYVGSNLEYARYVHDGTVNQKANPFIRKAINNNIKNIKAILRDSLNK